RDEELQFPTRVAERGEGQRSLAAKQPDPPGDPVSVLRLLAGTQRVVLATNLVEGGVGVEPKGERLDAPGPQPFELLPSGGECLGEAPSGFLFGWLPRLVTHRGRCSSRR